MVRKFTSAVLAMLMLCMCLTTGLIQANALGKINESRAIAIVFDNSGSMYADNGKPLKRWCQATYAMEVFASMLNKGDTLLIYPMWPITVDDKEYTMDNPLKITDSADSSKIRDIYTPSPDTTPIESVDCAINGIQGVKADKKYVIILTDGTTFNKNTATLTKEETRSQLDMRIRDHAGPDLTMMYLGIGSNPVVPNESNSEYFTKMQADDNNSAEILSKLTQMCNQIFGRDTLPENRISGNTINFDISMSKLIVFVQGENISDLELKSESGQILTPTEQTSTKYSTKGNGNKYCPFLIDDSLQGLMVTYENCDAGSYTIDYSGKETSIEVYYEPDADLDFVFTDIEGNTVNPDALYEGEYKVSFGMKDAKTGELISSELLGTPKYRGTYSINEEKTQITYDGHSSFEEVSLKMDDAFDANLTVTYLSGYTITKNSTDFGWPFGGIKVAARPAGNLKLDISGGEDIYSLQDLKEGTPYIAKIYHEGKQLTGEELRKVVLEWNPDTSNAEIKQEFADDHFNLWLDYKDPTNPQDTKCGKCSVTIFASYRAEGSDNAQAQRSLSYMIRDDFSPLLLDLHTSENYITIKDLDNSSPIVANLSLKGNKLSSEDFDAVKLTVDCAGIEHTITPDKEASAYLIKLLPTEDIPEGDYLVSVTAEYTDHIGRVTQTEDSLNITLSNIPLWLKWLFWIVVLLLIALIIWLWLRTPVLPKKIRLSNISVKVAGQEMKTIKANVIYPTRGKRREIKIKGTGALANTHWSTTLIPAKDSYRYLPSKKRKAVVINGSVKASGYVSNITIGTEAFSRDSNNKLIRISRREKDFNFPKTRINYSGTKDINGSQSAYSVTGDIKFE